MSDNDKKLTPEQMKQMQQLQQMMMQQLAAKQGGVKAQDKPKLTLKQRLEPKRMLNNTFVAMQNSVKFVDQFTNFVVGRGDEGGNDVVKSARAPVMFGAFVIIFFVIFGLLWAGTAPLDSAAHAIGKVITDTKKKSINHQYGGVVKKVFVNVGDYVKEGDKLIELDESTTRAEYDGALNQYRSLLGSEARLIAEINEQDQINFPEFLLKDQDLPEVQKVFKTQRHLFESKKLLLQAERDGLTNKVHQIEKQIEGYNAKKISLEKSLEVLKERVISKRQLNKQGHAPKEMLLEAEAREADAKSQLAINDTEIANRREELAKTEIELINLESKFSTQNLTELKDVQTQLAAQREKYHQLRDMLNKIIIKAPVSGVVNWISDNVTVGYTIQSFHPIIEIFPEEEALIVEAKISPQNIDSVRVGLIAKMRFAAFKSRTTPLIVGHVTSLSPDIVIDQYARDPRTGMAQEYYLARIEIDMEHFNSIAKDRGLVMQPGMQADVTIVTGTRTLLRYILDPLFDAMFKGFKER